MALRPACAAEGKVQPLTIIVSFDRGKQLLFRRFPRGKRVWWTSSVFSVPKQLSVDAISFSGAAHMITHCPPNNLPGHKSSMTARESQPSPAVTSVISPKCPRWNEKRQLSPIARIPAPTRNVLSGPHHDKQSWGPLLIQIRRPITLHQCDAFWQHTADAGHRAERPAWDRSHWRLADDWPLRWR